MVEHLGSGIPRILTSNGRECFKFTDNFLRMTIPSFVEVTAQVTALIIQLEDEMDRQGLQDKLSLSHKKNFLLKLFKACF